MRYKLLGKSGLHVAELVLDTMTFGLNRVWGADQEESRMNQRKSRKSLVVGLIVGLAALVWLGCGFGETPRQPPPPPPPPPTLASPTQPPLPADLQILGVNAALSSQGNNFRVLKVDVQNSEPGIANSFDLVCNWSCPGGSVSNYGAVIVQGGYLKGHGRFSYQNDGLIGCAGPPAILNLMCTVDVDKEIEETNESNNVWQGSVQIPF
jgi:hypothetical protein